MLMKTTHVVLFQRHCANKLLLSKRSRTMAAVTNEVAVFNFGRIAVQARQIHSRRSQAIMRNGQHKRQAEKPPLLHVYTLFLSFTHHLIPTSKHARSYSRHASSYIDLPGPWPRSRISKLRLLRNLPQLPRSSSSRHAETLDSRLQATERHLQGRYLAQY